MPNDQGSFPHTFMRLPVQPARVRRMTSRAPEGSGPLMLKPEQRVENPSTLLLVGIEIPTKHMPTINQLCKRFGLKPEQTSVEGFQIAVAALQEHIETGRAISVTWQDGDFVIEAIKPKPVPRRWWQFRKK